MGTVIYLRPHLMNWTQLPATSLSNIACSSGASYEKKMLSNQLERMKLTDTDV